LALVVAGIASTGFLVAAIAADKTEKRRAYHGRPPAAEKQRAAAPTSWDKMVAEAFFEDAFSVVGQRPANEGAGQLPAPPVPQQPDEFDRTALMKSLKQAENSIAQAIASEKTFKQHAALLDEQIEIITGIALKLKGADPDYKDDADYQHFVQSMRDSAASMRSGVKNMSYEASGVSFGKLKQSCDSCHGAFR
jgi:cytochrome c556